ncbi:MAG: IS66 family transposase, partial [Gammaproteobacteria bacterium]
KVSELCQPLVKLLREHIIVYDYAQADETTVQVLDEIGRSNKSKSYIWCYRGGGIKPCIVYEYQETRGGYHAEEFLAGFKGYLQSDAYSGYNFADKDDGIVRVGCMAHARRKFADIIKISKTDGLAHEAIKYFKALYKIENESREENASPSYRFALRNEKAKPKLKAFKTWLDSNLTKVPVQSKIGEAIRYTLSNWELLTKIVALKLK